MPTKCLHVLYGNFIGRGKYTLNNVAVTNDGEYFSFPAITPVNHLYSVRVSKESCYDDVTFRFIVTLRNVTSSSRIGICLKSATDGFDGEKAMFVIGDGTVSFWYGNSKQLDLGGATIAELNNRQVVLEMRRHNDSYIFRFNGQEYTRRIIGDGSVHRQNVNACLYGSGIDAKIDVSCYYTETPEVQFGLLGDSIANGYSSGGGWETTIKGILTLEEGISIGDFAGSANVIKDSLDSMPEIAIVKPAYAIVMYGHNDLFFNTGRLTTDFPKLETKLYNYGITPIFLNLNPSTWVDESIANAYIQNRYFNVRHLHSDLTGVLTPPGDFTDGAHPTVGGNRKLADHILTVITPLL